MPIRLSQADFDYYAGILDQFAAALGKRDAKTARPLSVGVRRVKEMVGFMDAERLAAEFEIGMQDLEELVCLEGADGPVFMRPAHTVAAQRIARAWREAGPDIIKRKMEAQPVTQPATLSRIDELLLALQQFPDAMRPLTQGRKKKAGKAAKGIVPRQPYPLGDEYDVQDALWVHVRMAYAEACREDPTPKKGPSSSNIDFTIPSVGAAIEVKYARPDADVKEMKKALLQDIADVEGRQDLSHFIIFIAEAPNARGHTQTLAALNAEKRTKLVTHVVRVAL